MKSTITTFCVSAIVGATLATSSSALATTYYLHSYPAFMCVTNYGRWTLEDVGQLVNTDTSTVYSELYCPIVSNGQAYEDPSIWFYSNGNNALGISPAYSIEAELCAESNTGGNGTCGGPSYYTGAAGSHSLTAIPTTDYNNSDFNFLDVYMTEESSGSYNVLFGYGISLGAE
jgi:hypothetical protein